jgi:copper(I)-binding protein
MHEMKLEGDVMRMRALERLDLPAGKPVALKPGGYHLMLQGLKAPLQPGTSIPVTLTFRTARNEQRELALQVPVSATPPKEAGGGSRQPQALTAAARGRSRNRAPPRTRHGRAC